MHLEPRKMLFSLLHAYFLYCFYSLIISLNIKVSVFPLEHVLFDINKLSLTNGIILLNVKRTRGIVNKLTYYTPC